MHFAIIHVGHAQIQDRPLALLATQVYNLEPLLQIPVRAIMDIMIITRKYVQYAMLLVPLVMDLHKMTAFPVII